MRYPICLSFLMFSILAGSLPADDSAKLSGFFAKAAETRGGIVTIPPGDYAVDGSKPLPLASGMTVFAYGARFHLPSKLGDQARVVLFTGENIRDFRWFGGHFAGHVFDPAKPDSAWEPNVNTRVILITTTPGGRTENLTFRDVSSDGVAGAVVTVLGAEKINSDRAIETYATNISLENCTLLRSGKFMWDYGYLWQITVWPEDYTPAERAMAAKYFRQDLVRGPLRFEAGQDRILIDGKLPTPPNAKTVQKGDSVCFFGDVLPSNIIRGRQYFIVESAAKFLRISEKPGGDPICFAGSSGHNVKLIRDLGSAWPALYAPMGCGPGKGAFDLVGCRQVTVRGCRLSALGDTMHIQKSRDVIFDGNHIAGSRMGAFFLAEFCKNATITGNTVDGTNGSRVMSVEKSCEDVTIVGNTFRNGGRGSWINQPRNLILADNVFVNNTTKCERDPQRGRRSFGTGDYERYSELYFTTHESGGRYGNVVIRGNIFVSGPFAEHAISFMPGGDTILIADNIFRGSVGDIDPTVGCNAVTIRNNIVESLISSQTFYSEALRRDVAFTAYVPEGATPPDGWPLVLLLHGAGRNHRTVVDDSACRMALQRCKMVIVMVNGRDGWYLDSPVDPKSRHQTMLRELLDEGRRRFPVSPKPEHTGICGWSMGGYGAVRFAEVFSEDVGAVAVTIALVDFPNANLPANQNFGVSPLFGKDDKSWPTFNCMTHVDKLRGKSLLAITAKDAFDLQMNRNFHARLTQAGIAHDYREINGGHDFLAVRATLPILLGYLEEHLAPKRK